MKECFKINILHYYEYYVVNRDLITAFYFGSEIIDDGFHFTKFHLQTSSVGVIRLTYYYKGKQLLSIFMNIDCVTHYGYQYNVNILLYKRIYRIHLQRGLINPVSLMYLAYLYNHTF